MKKIDRYSLDKKDIAAAVMEFLGERPYVIHSYASIGHWWLMKMNIEYHLDILKQVLDDLVRDGLILERKDIGLWYYQAIGTMNNNEEGGDQ